MTFRELLRFDLSRWVGENGGRRLEFNVGVDLGGGGNGGSGKSRFPSLPTNGRDRVGVAGEENGEATKLLLQGNWESWREEGEFGWWSEPSERLVESERKGRMRKRRNRKG